MIDELLSALGGHGASKWAGRPQVESAGGVRWAAGVSVYETTAVCVCDFAVGSKYWYQCFLPLRKCLAGGRLTRIANLSSATLH